MSSLLRSTQTPLQLVLPAEQHTPDWQVPLQAVAVQLPQWAASVWRFTQAPLQLVKPMLQLTPHIVPLQVALPFAGWLHALQDVGPQLDVLLLDEQVVPQR